MKHQRVVDVDRVLQRTVEGLAVAEQAVGQQLAAHLHVEGVVDIGHFIMGDDQHIDDKRGEQYPRQ